MLNQPDGQALANLLLGIWAVAQGEAAKAIDCLQHDRVWFEKNQAVYFLGWTYCYLADAFALEGTSEQALHYYRLAVQLREDADGYSAFQWVWETIAIIEPTQAITLCQQQLMCQRQNQPKVVALLQTLGHISIVAGDLPGALAVATECLALWQKLGIDWRRGWYKPCLSGFSARALPASRAPTSNGLPKTTCPYAAYPMMD